MALTFILEWVIQDAIVLIVTLMTVVYIIKNEEHPEIILLEMFCFCVLYAAVYENFATLIGLYAYGRSLIMIFNVPISVPLVEYLVVYASLRMLKHTDIPTWCKPFIVGFMGTLFDLTLDPVATHQIFPTEEGVVGRWTWFIGPTDVHIYGVPVHNYTGWLLMLGYAAALLLLGRYWYKKSNYKRSVGYAYPVLTMLGALLLLITPPISRFLLALEPIFPFGGIGEWIMLGVFFAVPTVLLVVYWRGKMKSRITFKTEYPLFLVLVGFHINNIIFALIGGFYEILWIVVLFAAIQSGIVFFVYRQGKLADAKPVGNPQPQ